MTWKGYENVTEADLGIKTVRAIAGERLEPGQLVALAVKPKRGHKYGAQPHCVLPDLRVLPEGDCGGVESAIRFSSKREAERFVLLALERERGAITDLELQPQYTLSVIDKHGTRHIIGRYIADFRYRREGQLICEDAKGMKTAIYSWKKHHCEIEHGITILET